MDAQPCFVQLTISSRPITNASVYLLKHDRSNPCASKILNELRKTAKEDIKLVLVDTVIPFACRYSKAEAENAIPGAVPAEAPELYIE